MAIQTVTNIGPLDPNLKTGPSRLMSGPVRIKAVTLGTPYGEKASWLYCGVAGDVSIILWDGSTVVLPALAGGVWHPISTLGVNTSGTAATGLFWGS